MEQGYLLDTNIAVYLLHGKLSPKAAAFLKKTLRRRANLSIVTKIELLSWGEESELYSDFIENSDIYPLSDNVVSKSIDVRKTYRTNLPDAIIAATAITHDLVLVTRNQSDFKRIKELKWVNPFES